jgi:hypothetical protein
MLELYLFLQTEPDTVQLDAAPLLYAEIVCEDLNECFPGQWIRWDGSKYHLDLWIFAPLYLYVKQVVSIVKTDEIYHLKRRIKETIEIVTKTFSLRCCKNWNTEVWRFLMTVCYNM